MTECKGGGVRAHEPARPLPRFGSFMVVGALGFVVDAAILSSLVHFGGWSPYTARALSFAAAVTVTWYCNRRFVFVATNRASREYGAYFTVQLIGAAINVGAYAVIIELVPTLARTPVVPLACGAALALLFNYFASGRFVFLVQPPGPASVE